MKSNIMKHLAALVGCLTLSLSLHAQFTPEQLGELPMGYDTAWTGRTLFNSEGGYNGQYNTNESTIHGWSPLYVAMPDDVYKIHFNYPTPWDDNGRVHFKTPITIDASHTYTFKIRVNADKDVKYRVFLSELDDDSKRLMSDELNLSAGKNTTRNYRNLTGVDIADLKLALEILTPDDQYNTVLTVSNLSLIDNTTNTELWVGTPYFNWCMNWTNVTWSRVPDMEIEGRTECTEWIMPDFDDSQWTQTVMPIGNADYNPRPRTVWPGGENTNFWIRRDFELAEVKASTAYFLRVCHDDAYRVYVNGHLMDSDEGWTNGKNPVEVEVPARYLKVGRNVIATYIQQNWGGKFFDCGMRIQPDAYDEGDAGVDPTKALSFNEVNVANVDQTLDHSLNYGGWVEIYNSSESRIALNGLYLSDDPAQLDKYQLTSTAGVIPAKSYYCLYFDNNPTPTHPYFEQVYAVEGAKKQIPFKLNADGGSLYLSEDGITAFTSVTYPAAISRCSWACVDYWHNDWNYNGQPTPGAENDRTYFARERLAPPVVNVDSRLFTDPLYILVDVPDGCTLRYTLDGTTPTLDNGYATKKRYETSISSTSSFRFRLFRDGYLPSEVVTRTYIYNDHDYYLPIVAVTTDPRNLYDDQIGIWVDGTNGQSGRNHGNSNRNMDWNRPVNVEYLTPDGRMVINQEANTCISGGWSRHYLPASFKLKANKIFEGRNSFDAQLFPNKPYNKYKQLLVRNGGNDNNNEVHGRVRDAITQQVLISNGFYVDAQDYQPVHVFFNGQHIGQMNLREPNNRFNGTANYGYDDDEMDAFEYSDGYSQMAGTRDAFQQWIDLARRASDPDVYAQLCDLVDIDEVINYFAAITYIGCSDWIMNNNNLKGYRSLPDGKFHLTVLDQDWGWSNTSAVRSINNQWGNDMVAIYNGMKQNADFCRQFVDAYCILHGSVFTPERCLAIGDSICRLVEPALAIEKKQPWTSWSEQKDRMISDWARNDRMNALRDAYALGTGMKVKIQSNIPQAQLMLNNLPVPDARFDGTLFAPVTLTATAPAGYAFCGWQTNQPFEEELFDRNSEWRYYDQGSLDDTGWHLPDYDDSAWSAGAAPLGYWVGHEGQRDYKTTIEYGGNTGAKHPAYYFRKSFNLPAAPQAADEYVLNVQADDGYVVYVNGVERYRYLMPEGDIRFDTYATTHAPDDLPSQRIALQPAWLQAGRNVVAIEVHNNVPGSSDIYFTAWFGLKTTSGSSIATGNQLVLDEDTDMELVAVFEPLAPAVQMAQGATPVRINEVSAGNDIYVNEYGKRDDWVELYNSTDHDIDIAGMYLSDKANSPQKYKVEAADGISTVIPANGHLIVWASKRDALSQLHAPFKLDNADGCFVSLQAADGSWTDVLRYDEHDGRQSFGRYPDGANDTYLMSRPTIDKHNALTTYDFLLSDLEWDGVASPATHTFELAQGWNWFSHNMASAVATSTLKTDNHEWRGQSATYKNVVLNKWSGTLEALQPTLGYKVQATKAHDISLTDQPYNTFLPATVQKGWNWIGCPLANATTIDAALGNYQATEGDMLVGQDAFAIYTQGEWRGPLTSVQPGRAYMLKCGWQQAFEWNALSRPHKKGRRYARRVDELDGAWTYSQYAYPDAMPLIIQLQKSGQPVAADGYQVGAFVGDECRGAAQVEDGLGFLMVYGDDDATEQGPAQTVTFRVLDLSGEELYLATSLPFHALDAKGTPAEPYVLDLDNLSAIEQPTCAGRVVAIEYYTLDGRRVSQPTSGIVLQRLRYENGSTATRKVLR